jgi:DNA-binding Lrp family transcriptional regulator
MLNACILVKTIPTKVYEILDSIKKIENVRKSYVVYGRFDIVAFIEAPDYATVRAITGKINSMEGVRSTETLVEA